MQKNAGLKRDAFIKLGSRALEIVCVAEDKEEG